MVRSAANPGLTRPRVLQAQHAGRVGGEELDHAVEGQQLRCAPGGRKSTANEVSMPMTPNGANSNSLSLSSRVCGAWSEAMQSMVPSCRPRISSRRSLLGAQRRLDLVHGVVGLDPLLVEQQVVRGDVGADRCLRLVGVADQLDRAGGGDVGQVQPRADAFLQDEVAGHDHLFGGLEDAAQTRTCRK